MISSARALTRGLSFVRPDRLATVHSFPCAAWALFFGPPRWLGGGCGSVGRCRHDLKPASIDSRAFVCTAGPPGHRPQFPMRCMGAVLWVPRLGVGVAGELGAPSPPSMY